GGQIFRGAADVEVQESLVLHGDPPAGETEKMLAQKRRAGPILIGQGGGAVRPARRRRPVVSFRPYSGLWTPDRGPLCRSTNTSATTARTPSKRWCAVPRRRSARRATVPTSRSSSRSLPRDDRRS